MSTISEHTNEIVNKQSVETVAFPADKLSEEAVAFPADKLSAETVDFAADKRSAETVAFSIEDNELPESDILGGNIVAMMTGGALWNR